MIYIGTALNGGFVYKVPLDREIPVLPEHEILNCFIRDNNYLYIKTKEKVSDETIANLR